MKKFLNNRKVVPYVFCLPFILMFVIVFLYPAITAVMMSFQKVDTFSGAATWNNFSNYKKLFGDSHFWVAFKNTLIYTCVSLALNVPLSLLIANMLNSKLMGGKLSNVFRSVLFLPTLTSAVVAGIVFRLAFSAQPDGVMNRIIGLFGLEPFGWLTTQSGQFISLAILNIWLNLGINVVYYLSGLQSIPTEMYEAADLDGASATQKFFHLTLPLLKPTSVYVMTMSILAGFSMFTESHVLWNGNFAGDKGLTIVAYLYQNGFRKNNFGYAATVGIVLMLLVLAVNLVQMFFNGSFKKEGN